MSEEKKIIFSMSGVTKTFKSSNSPVLKNIYLSFFYGAKIGILGLNGSGKSTLLKIIAGEDKNYQGDLVFSNDYSVGYLEQEPKLDSNKTVLDVVKEGVSSSIAILDEYNKINDMFGLEEVYSNSDEMEKLMNRQAQLQDQIDACNAWDLETKLEIAMDALRTHLMEIKKLKFFLVGRDVGLLFVAYYYKNLMFYFLMNQQITLMQNLYIGLNNT